MKMSERIAADLRDLTLTLAQGVGIGFGGDAAYRAWLAQQTPRAEPGQDAVARQRATIGRLQMLFAQQPARSGLRTAIKMKPD